MTSSTWKLSHSLIGERRGSLLLLGVYAVVWGLTLPNALFVGDDGRWVEFMYRFRNGTWGWHEILAPRAPTGGRPVSNSLLGAALHQIPYAVHASVWAIYVWVLLLSLVAHWLILEIYPDRERRRTMQAASLFYFSLPAFLAVDTLRVWQVGYQPVALAAMLWGLLRYVDHGRLRDLCIGMTGAALAVHFHPAAFFLLPALLFAFQGLNRDSHPGFHLIVAGSLYLSLLSPYLVDLFRRGWHLFPCAVVASIPAAVAARRYLPRLDRKLVWVIVALPFVLPWLIRFRSTPRAPLAALLDMLGAPNNWVAARVGNGEAHTWPLPAHLTPGSVTFLACLAVTTWRYGKLTATERALWAVTTIPTVIFTLTAIVHNSWPHQRPAFICLPAAILIAGVLLTTARSAGHWARRTGVALYLALIVLNAGDSADKHLRLARNGGVNMHCASLGEKYDVLRYIASQPGRPRFVLVHEARRRSPFAGCGDPPSWYSLLRDAEFSCPEGEVRNYYLVEPRSSSFDRRYLTAVEALPRRSEKSFRSVKVIESPALDKSLGAVFPLPACKALAEASR